MADIADNASSVIEQDLARSLARYGLPAVMATDPDCEDCGVEIPARRREAAPWVTTCIDCQSIREARRRHVR